MSAEITRHQATGQWYPVVIEFTEHRVVMVESTSQAAAVRDVKTMDALYEYWEGAEKLDVLDGVVVSDGFTASTLAPTEHDSPIGPFEACPECGGEARDWGSGPSENSLAYADHLPTCASFVHRVDKDGVHAAVGDWTLLGWYLTCSCEAPGLERTWQKEPLPNGGGHYRAVEHFPGRTVYPKTPEGDAALAAAAREHVAGRPHSKNVPFGILDDVRHADLRRRGLVTA